MAKYKITEDEFQNIISESINKILIESQNDESIGGWLGKQVGKLGKWANDNVNDYRSNKQQYKQGQTSSAKTPTQPQNAEPQSNTGNQITLQDIEQALTQLNQQFAALKGEKPVQTNGKQQTTSQQGNQNAENDVQKLQQAFFDEIKKGKEAGLGYDKKTKQFTNPHNLTNVDLEKWNAELKPYYQKWYQAFKANQKLNETKIRKMVSESLAKYLKTMK